jgi:hypothetical protein
LATTPYDTVSERLEASWLGRVSELIEENGALVVVVGSLAIVMVASLRSNLLPDGWMALVSGREIAMHGLPSQDTLTVWAHGRRWVDQQWLAQLFLYGLWRVGGLKLALLAHAALTVGAFGAAIVLARRLGASARSTTWVSLPVLVTFYPAASAMRPQSFAYPLFVAVLWLLVTDARRPSRRVFVVLPLLVLWANLHGSVLLGAALASLAGLVGLAAVPPNRPRRVLWHALGLALAPWPCLLVSPYALHLPSYAETVLGGSGFSDFVTEWTPTTLTAVTIPLYLLVIGGVWLLGRTRRRLSAFEKLAFLATAVLAFQTLRDIVWFGLVALVVLPQLFDDVIPTAPEPRRLNRLLATAICGGVLVAAAGVATHSPSWFERDFPPAAADAAAAAAGPEGRVLATSRYADWLLWTHPELAGRVAFDSRFELLTPSQLERAARFLGRSGAWAATARPYRVLVLGKQDDSQLRAALRQSGLARVVRIDRNVAVLRHTGLSLGVRGQGRADLIR